ncbi:MAG: hypothetical protein K0U84_15445 [Actinomycetia bacterium]|nr:hypothetical protein [Actinomycetes bacterium]
MGVSNGTEYAGKAIGSLTDSHIGRPAAPPSPIPQSLPQTTREKIGKARSAFGSPILKAGQVLIDGMRLTTGWGDPVRGESFGQGSARFLRAGETVTSSYPSDEWQGVGSRAYATANRRQADHTESMATLDRNVERVIERQAYQVAMSRDNLEEQSGYLGDLSHVTWAMALIPGIGAAMKTIVELAAVSAALSACGYTLYQLSQEAGENAGQLRELAEEYSALSLRTAPPDLGDAPGSPPVSGGPPRPGQSDQSASGRPAPTLVPGLPPTPAPSGALGGAPASAGVALPPAGPLAQRAATPAVGPAVTAPAAATGMMSELTPAFSALGGMVGSVVAPLAAVLTGAAGAAGAAGQSLSMLTTDAAAAGEVGAMALDEEMPATESEDDRALDDSTALAGHDGGHTTPEIVAESAELRPQQTNTPEPLRPHVPAAATRPPL